MSQPQIKNITPIRPDGYIHCYHDRRLYMQTSHTGLHPNQKFFSCPYPKESGKCRSFHWLADLRHDPKWDEALFRSAYAIPPEELIEGVSSPAQKRQLAEDAQLGPSQSPKRPRHNDGDDDDFFSLPEPSVTRVPRINDPSTPSRGAFRDDRSSGWPMTPPSTSRTNRALAEVPPSPSEESLRRRDLRLHLQNFDDSMSATQSEISSGGRPSPQSSVQPAFADDLDVMSARLKDVSEYIRKLERIQAAKQGTIDGRNSRIHFLETELERVVRENEKLIRENERLTRENERLSRS